jgi:hypothetical protein
MKVTGFAIMTILFSVLASIIAPRGPAVEPISDQEWTWVDKSSDTEGWPSQYFQRAHNARPVQLGTAAQLRVFNGGKAGRINVYNNSGEPQTYILRDHGQDRWLEKTINSWATQSVNAQIVTAFFKETK